MVDKYPNNKSHYEDYKWFCDIYDDLQDQFHENNFIFNLGLMLYTASK